MLSALTLSRISDIILAFESARRSRSMVKFFVLFVLVVEDVDMLRSGSVCVRLGLNGPITC